MYETFEHTADLGLRIEADTLEDLFAEAARALFSLVIPDLESVRTSEGITLTIQGDSRDLLLFDWLNELLYIHETRHLVLAEFDVRLTAEGLAATAKGEPIDRQRHELDHEVKAITYHGLKLLQRNDGWMAEVIVDI